MFKIGDLVNLRGRLCLVVDIHDDPVVWRKRAMIQWVSDLDEYWIGYDILVDLAKENEMEIENANR